MGTVLEVGAKVTEQERPYGLELADVYREHGPGAGWAELQHRSICPPTPSSESDLDLAIRREVGHLSVEIDYVELGH